MAIFIPSYPRTSAPSALAPSALAPSALAPSALAPSAAAAGLSHGAVAPKGSSTPPKIGAMIKPDSEISAQDMNFEPDYTGHPGLSDTQVAKLGPPVYWGRLVTAFLLLAVILIAGLWSATENLDKWSTLLMHSFELALGLILGILGGEYAAKR